MSHKHHFDCEDTLQNLNAYIDGELDHAMCDEIEEHIQHCPNCQVIVNTLRKTIEIYQADGRDTHLPEDVRNRLYACFDLDEDVKQS
jgi:anti-sigma factor (TIGR02949 family)